MLFGKKKDVENVKETNENKNLNETLETTPDETLDLKSDKSKTVKATKSDDNKTVQTEGQKPAYSKFSGVDFNKMSKEKLFSVIVELILENKKIYQDNEKLKEELLESEKSTANVRKDMSKTGDIIELIAQKICPSIIEMENNGKKLTDDAKARIIIDNTLNEKKKFMTNILLFGISRSRKEMKITQQVSLWICFLTLCKIALRKTQL